MTTAVTFWQGSGPQVTALLDHAEGVPGVGVHQLSWPCKLQASWLDANDAHSTVPLLLAGRVWLDGPAQLLVGELSLLATNLRGFHVGEALRVSLSTDQLRLLERQRGEHGISFRFDLNAATLGAAGPVGATSVQATLHTPETSWRPVLDRLGTELDTVIRVRSPLTEINQQALAADENEGLSLQGAVERLRSARAELRDHQYEHCVSTCRKVIETVRKLSHVEPLKAIQLINAEQRTQAQRWGLIAHDLFSLTSPSHHADDVATRFVWTRHEAEGVLATTAALLMRYQESHLSD